MVLDFTHVVVKTAEQFVFHADHLNKQNQSTRIVSR